MKCAFLLSLVCASCFAISVATEDQQVKNGPLLDSLLRVRRSQHEGVNYGFPTFPDFSKHFSNIGPAQGPQFPNFAPGNGEQSRGLGNRFLSDLPDPSQFKGNQGWVTTSCVYDKKGKASCVERHGDKPKD
uniref:Uncharacterized protein n=1 Tax=Anopheles dirus TaxID=7168 RepID=A0A182NYW6_9DIPT